MRRRSVLRRRITSVCAAVIAGSAIGLIPVADATPAATVDWELQGEIDAYLRDYPGMTPEQAARAVEGQGRRIEFIGRIVAENPDGFGGSWFDPRTNTQHVNTVGSAVADQTRRAGREFGLTVATHQVTHSTAALEKIASEINEGGHPVLGQAGVDRATADYQRGQVRVGLPAPELARFQGDVLDAPVVLRQAEPGSVQPEVCTNRFACGRPLRSGINIGPYDGRIGRAIEYCSLGFTATATDGSKWAITAAHCREFAMQEGLGTVWGHGEQVIGEARHPRWDDPCRIDGYSAANCKIDVARILVQNSYWTTGGWFFNGATGQANTPLPVDGAVTRPEQIQAGDTACLSAVHSEVGVACGTIIAPGSASSMARVNFDGCRGDSGGGWYHKNAAGQRIALGIHAGQPSDQPNSTCHLTNDSMFSTLPNINYWWDQTTAATLRVETR